MSDIETKSAELKSEATNILDRLSGLSPDTTNLSHARLVECIVCAAILDVTSIMGDAMKEQEVIK